MGHRGQKFNSLGDLFTATQNQFDGMSQRITDLTDFVWEHLPVEFPEISEVAGSEFLPLVVIAAVDAPDAWISYASVSPYGFVCDGIDDEAEFLAAELIIQDGVSIFDFSTIWLSPGTFSLNAGSAHTIPGTLSGRYKGHNDGLAGFDFTSIDVNTGWASIPEVSPGLLSPALQLLGQFADITLNFIPDAQPEGDMFWIVTANGDINNLDFNIGSTSPPIGFPVVCEVAVGLGGGTTGGCSNCNVNLARQGIFPTDAYADITNVSNFTLNGVSDGSEDPLPKLLLCRGRCNDITIEIVTEQGFVSGAYPIQIDGDAILSNVRLFGDFDWTGIDGVVQIASNFENDDDPIVVDVSTFLVDSADHPRIFYRDDSFEDIVNLGSHVLHGTTDERPAADMCIGTVYINTDNPAAPVLEWSDGTVWWQSGAMT